MSVSKSIFLPLGVNLPALLIFPCATILSEYGTGTAACEQPPPEYAFTISAGVSFSQRRPSLSFLLKTQPSQARFSQNVDLLLVSGLGLDLCTIRKPDLSILPICLYNRRIVTKITHEVI